VQTGSVEGEVVASRYRLTSRLSSGGMGTVWRAEDELLQRPVAVKEVGIPAGMPAREVDRLRQRYLREARAAARLRHENVVVVHDVISEASQVWIVMELFDTPDLAAIVREDGPLEPAAVARIGLQMLDALGAAHAAGVLHRDVKPANVLVCENGRAVLTDFGVASVTGDASLTVTGQLIGSPAYFAPERLTGGQVGPASDLWSLGCTLYAAVEGQSPFWREEPFEILTAITVEALPEPRLAGPLAPVIVGLLEKDQSQRWDAEHTRAALEQVVAGKVVETAPAWGAPVRSRPAESTPAGAAEPGIEPARSDAEPAGAPQPGPDPLPSGEPPPRRPWWRRRAVLAAVVVLLFAAGVTAYVVDDNLRADAQAEGSIGSEGAQAQDDLSYTHPAGGYTVLVPLDWEHTEENETLWSFTPGAQAAPSTGRMTIFVGTVPARGKSSLAIAEQYDRKLAADDNGYPQYRRWALGWRLIGQYRGALSEFTYTNPSSGPRHVVIFRTVLNGICYEISLNGPADQFDSSRPVFYDVARSLRLPE